ncbi:hypothetical protein KY329_02305 [Candidatus Woesearchaeota archaeon]|nr:hypothetical protein [Candidatus Woesearchaeota archaeon]
MSQTYSSDRDLVQIMINIGPRIISEQERLANLVYNAVIDAEDTLPVTYTHECRQKTAFFDAHEDNGERVLEVEWGHRRGIFRGMFYLLQDKGVTGEPSTVAQCKINKKGEVTGRKEIPLEDFDELNSFYLELLRDAKNRLE